MSSKCTPKQWGYYYSKKQSGSVFIMLAAGAIPPSTHLLKRLPGPCLSCVRHGQLQARCFATMDALAVPVICDFCEPLQPQAMERQQMVDAMAAKLAAVDLQVWCLSIIGRLIGC